MGYFKGLNGLCFSYDIAFPALYIDWPHNIFETKLPVNWFKLQKLYKTILKMTTIRYDKEKILINLIIKKGVLLPLSEKD